MRILFQLIVIGIFFMSCRTQKIPIENYLQSMNDTLLLPIAVQDPVIQKNDLLNIQVYSLATNPSIDQPYNLRTAGGEEGGVAGFLVDANGNIEYPRLGTIHVEGLRKTELAEVLKNKLQNELKSPTVIIRFINYSVTVLGEVRTPGVLNVSNENLTVLEALGMAGDITEFGNKSRLKILRENNGRRQVGTIDLTSDKFFTSPYYQLQQNDVVFVEQNQKKSTEEERLRRTQQIGIATSIVSVVVLLLTFLR